MYIFESQREKSDKMKTIVLSKSEEILEMGVYIVFLTNIFNAVRCVQPYCMEFHLSLRDPEQKVGSDPEQGAKI